MGDPTLIKSTSQQRYPAKPKPKVNMVTFSTEPISDSTHTYSNSPMTLVDNDPSASPGLAEQAQPPPYAASPTRSLFNLTWNSVTEMGTDAAAAAALTESEMSEEGETTSVVHHLQRDSDIHSVNTECNLLVGMTMSPSRTNCSDEGVLFRMPNLLVNTAGGIMSPPRLNFFSEEAPFLTPNFLADMVGGMMMSTSPPRMNYFSPPSGDSIGNSDPYRLWNFADHSEAQELENRKGMTMRPTCIEEVDAGSALGQNQNLGIWAAALEAESRGETVRQSCCWGSHPQPQTSDDYSCNTLYGLFHIHNQLVEQIMTSLPTMNYSLPSYDSHSLGGSFHPYLLRDDGVYSVVHDLNPIVKVTHFFLVVGAELFFEKKFFQNMATKAVEFLNMLVLFSLLLEYIDLVSCVDLIERSRGGMMEQNSVTYLQIRDQIDGHILVSMRQLSSLITLCLQRHVFEFEVEGLKCNFCIPRTLASSNRSLDSFILLGSCKPGPMGVTPCLLNLECLHQNMVVELGNGEQIMRLNVKLKQAYLEVVFSSEKSNAICSELESWGGMIMERISVNHQWRYAFCSSKTHPWRVILELLDVVVRQLLYLGTNNYSFGISVNDDRSSVNTKMHSLLYFERAFLEMQHLNSLESEFLDHFEKLVQTGVLELLSGEEIKLRYLQQEEVGTASQKNHSFSILPALLEAECRMMQLFGKRRRDILKVIPSAFKGARHDFGITRCSLEEVGTASEENHTADIWPAQYNAAAGREGMLLQQEDSSPEAHIPEPSATNEERNNVVELKSIDAKGGNSSSEKTNTISRWEKDYGITRQALEQLFGKSRDDAAKTFKVSTSTFKRACRDLGINRWPNHNRKRTNSSLKQKQHAQAVKKHKGNQSCPALPPEEATTTFHLPPEEATTTTLQGNSAMSVKVTYEDNTIRFPLPSFSTMKYLEEQLETRFKISLEIFSIMYQDEEDDWISLTCDSDLMYGMNVLRSSGKTVVKMKIKPNFG